MTLKNIFEITQIEAVCGCPNKHNYIKSDNTKIKMCFFVSNRIITLIKEMK